MKKVKMKSIPFVFKYKIMRKRNKPPPNERWEIHPDFPDYLISDFGRVYSLLTKKYITTPNNKCGYPFCGLYRNKKRKIRTVHRLVAEIYIPNLKNKLLVNHKNGIKSFNWYKNLEWSTYSENQKHGYKILGRVPANLGKKGSKNKLSKPVKQYNKDGTFVKSYNGLMVAERATGISSGNISLCCKGKIKEAQGFIWRYKVKRVRIR